VKTAIDVIGVEGIPLVKTGDNIAELILNALDQMHIQLRDDDIIVIAHTLVSKAEGRVVHADSVTPTKRALDVAKENGFDPIQVELALRVATVVLRESGVLITETANGLVCNFSGVDKTNAPEGEYILLPKDPDKSAEVILQSFKKISSSTLAVVISDTQGRPWRKGSVNIAVGCAGINAFEHYRGRKDLYGRVLKRSTVCHIDEIAAVAEPLMGQADEGIPAVLVRGYDFSPGSEKAQDINRPRDEDLFR
jgi:coenzyme F420-0:L-glutamate ligase/coenzyme F420-1:gamma-L-glutamate ligase